MRMKNAPPNKPEKHEAAATVRCERIRMGRVARSPSFI